MKKLLFILVVVMTAKVSFAQLGKGTILLGGSIGFYSSKNENDDKTTVIDFSPLGGYYLNENIAIGLGLGIMNDKIKFDDGDEQKHTDFLIAPFARYNMAITERASCYGQLMIGYGFGSFKDTYAGPPSYEIKGKTGSLNAGVGFGLNYFVKENLAFDIYYAALYFISSFDKPDGGEKSKYSEFGLNLNLASVNLGLNYYFGGTSAK